MDVGKAAIRATTLMLVLVCDLVSGEKRGGVNACITYSKKMEGIISAYVHKEE